MFIIQFLVVAGFLKAAFIIYYQEPTNILSRKIINECQRLVCQKREFDLTVKFSDLKLKNEYFVRIDMKISYISNYLFANNFLLLKLLLFTSCLCICIK